MSLQLREEIVIHEQLKLHPHPNVVRYHGVQVEDGYVVGLVLDKLDVNVIEALEYPIKKSRLWTVEEVVKDIKQGLDHLHALGIMHVSSHISSSLYDIF